MVRARAMREAAGTLSGYALGEDVEQPLTPAASLLDDLRVIFATHRQVRIVTPTGEGRRVAERAERMLGGTRWTTSWRQFVMD